jgi:long-chain acyl-CoA synthetase
MNLDLAPFIKDETTGEDYRFIGIYAKNREEWISCDIASILYGITTLPFYDTLGLDALKFVF